MTKKDNKDKKVVNQLVINKYADDSFGFHFKDGKYFDDGDLLYIARVMNHDVDLALKREDKNDK